MSDSSDDMEAYADLWDEGDPDARRESEWKEGEHTTKTGETILIKGMKTSHIENTIKYFNYLDTKPLKKELKKRKL